MSKYRTATTAEVRAAVADCFARRGAEAIAITERWVALHEAAGQPVLALAVREEQAAQTRTEADTAEAEAATEEKEAAEAERLAAHHAARAAALRSYAVTIVAKAREAREAADNAAGALDFAKLRASDAQNTPR